LLSRIDPDTLEPIPESGPTTVYLDLEGDPVSDARIVQKMGLIETTREEASLANLNAKIADLEELQSQMRDFTLKDMVLGGYNLAVTAGMDLATVLDEMAVIKRAGDALSTLDKIKDLARTQPTGLLTKLLTVVMRKLIWDPMKDAKHDLESYLSRALERHKSARDVLNEQGEILDSASAETFLNGLYLGEASEEAALYLFEAIFRNYARVLLKAVSPIVGMATFGLHSFIEVVKEAADYIEWTIDVNYNYTIASYEAFAKLDWKLADSGKYTLDLAQMSSKADEYQQKYLEKVAEGYKQAAQIPDAVVDYWRGFNPRTFFDSLKQIKLFSPCELRVYDTENRVTGMVDGELKEEIPNSVYDTESKTAVLFSPSTSHHFEAVGFDKGAYGLEVLYISFDEERDFSATDVPITPGIVHRYTVDWSALAEGKKGVTLQVDTNEDGRFENTFYVGAKLDGATLPITEIAPPVQRGSKVWLWVVLGVGITSIVAIIVLVRIRREKSGIVLKGP